MTWYRRFHVAAAVLALSAALWAQAAVEVASNASVNTTGQKRSDPQLAAANRGVCDRRGRCTGDQRVEGAGAIEDIPVRADGKITLLLVGDLQAAGTTTQNLQQELHDKLAAHMAVPEVAVIVQEVKSQKYNLMLIVAGAALR